MSRTELAQAVNAYLWEATGKRYELDGRAIARWERGEVLWPGAHYRSGLRAVLKANSDTELGFYPTSRGRSSAPTQQPEQTTSRYGDPTYADMDPAAFLMHVATEVPVPARISWADVERVKATSRAVTLSDNLFGGGLSRQVATSQLRWASRLLNASAPSDIRRDMFEAVGDLSGVVAFSAFDVADHATADECFQFTLWCADQADLWSLRANTLADMARKAAHLGAIGDALTLIEFAQVRSDRVTPTGRAMISAIRARLLALMGRHSDALAEADRADAHFSGREPDSDPTWLTYYDDAEHHGSVGRALIPVARQTGRPELASARLEAAISLHSADYARSRTFSRTRLASLLMTAGDPLEATAIGHQAVSDAASIRSHRIVVELRGLAKAAEPHARIGEVAGLRHTISTLALTHS
jgi:hypothetical protein